MRYVWVSILFTVVLGAAFGPAVLTRQPTADEELIVISPHWDGIRHEFGRAFSEDYFKTAGKHIQVTWLDLGGGTSEIKKYLEERLKQAAAGEGVGADILFGGGMDMLPGMAEKNFFEPYPLSAAQIHDIPPSVNGQELRDKENKYFAACLSGFGFVYNKLVVERAQLPTPKTWQDLGQPELQGWVSCGDPTNSGSLHMTFELVLQGEGWEKGYETLGRLVSNTRAFNEGGVSVPRDVSLGQAAVGPCIDFYASAPVRRQGATHLQLVIPAGQGVATPDCIAALRNPPNKQAAFAFITFVLSEAGQRLWYQARGTDGGPLDYDLERLPVMPRIYDMGLKTYTVMNPFKGAADFQYDSKKGGERWSMLNDLWRATLIDAHEALWDARVAAIRAHRDNDLGLALCHAPLSEAALQGLSKKRLAPDARNSLRNKWSAWAREWFKAIESAANNNKGVPEFKPAEN